ncbi:helix-turn-helix domain-containing protein [Luteimonas sp. A482]
MDRPNDAASGGTGQPLPAAAMPPGLARPAAPPGPAAHPRLPRILRCIEEELCDPALGGDALQRRFFVSRPTLYRMFRPLGGVARYIRERRLLLAHRRLREEPDCTITFLLYDLGFESERQFQRAFQGRFGMSPARWRNACRAQVRARGQTPSRRRTGT